MPRKSRIDAPGALYHIIARGINREVIFSDNSDRNNFLGRLGDILIEMRTACQLAQMLNLNQHAVSQAVTKGEEIHRSPLQIP